MNPTFPIFDPLFLLVEVFFFLMSLGRGFTLALLTYEYDSLAKVGLVRYTTNYNPGLATGSGCVVLVVKPSYLIPFWSNHVLMWHGKLYYRFFFFGKEILGANNFIIKIL